MNLEKINKIHFIGIGGIGISAIARMMLDLGKVVSGSDGSSSRIIEELQKLGAEIKIGHDGSNLNKDSDLVIYTIAISSDNPEFKKAKELGVKTLSYPEMLGVLSLNYKTIAVSGTHGKTSTTAMLSEILIDADKDPTVIIGSLLKDSGSNYIKGESDLLLVEACEYKRSFLNLKPYILAITNIEEEHLDYYKSLEDIQEAFSTLVSQVSPDGFVVCDSNDKKLKPVLEKANCKIVDYTKYIGGFKLNVPGEHNISNGAVALAIADILKINKEDALKSLEDYSGVWRRFEFKGETSNGVLVYDDYAHHHSEIRATLEGARDFLDGKIRVLFQPHLYSRTKAFLSELSESFSDVDEVFVLPIYAAREEEDYSINSKMLVDGINNSGIKASFVGDFDKAVEVLMASAQKGDVIITMGAGDVFKVGERLVKK